MSKLRLPTIEVFHDADSAAIEVEPALTGIEMVSDIAGKLQLINTERRLRLGLDADMIDEREIRWPKFAADLNVVLTNRQFSSVNEIGARVVGRAYFEDKGQRVALVTTQTHFVDEAVAHEVGHLFGLKNVKDIGASEEMGHCPKRLCIMTANHETYEYLVPKQTTMPRRWLERLGIAQPQYDIEPYSMTTGFCGGCADDLREAAVVSFMAKNGLNQARGIY